MENMSSGAKREVLPKYAVRYRKRAIGVNSFMDSWKKVRETANCQSIRNELPVAGSLYVRNKSVNTKRYTENEFTEGRDVV